MLWRRDGFSAVPLLRSEGVEWIHEGTAGSGCRLSRRGRTPFPVPWFPLIVIVLAQLQLNMNVSVLPVSLGPISEDLAAPTTAVATALLLYSLFVAAFVMLGAKIGKLGGERGYSRRASLRMALRWV